MATRSTIAILETSGIVKQIYCHWDGYLDHNGRILKQHYSTPELVKELISHGNLSVLAENINSTGPHSFNNPEKGVCVYYGRDRGESNVSFRKYPDFSTFRYTRQKEEYNYLFVEAECRWYLLDNRGNKMEFLKDLVLPTDNTQSLEEIYGLVYNNVISFDSFVKLISSLDKP